MNVVLKRLSEPSSWAGLAGLLAVAGINVDPGVLNYVVMVGAGIAGLVAFFVPEKS